MEQLHNAEQKLQETEIQLWRTEAKLCQSEEMYQQTEERLNFTRNQLNKSIAKFSNFVLSTSNHLGWQQEGLTFLYNSVITHMALNTALHQQAAHSLDELIREHQPPAIGISLSQPSSEEVPFMDIPDLYAGFPSSSMMSANATSPGSASLSLPMWAQ